MTKFNQNNVTDGTNSVNMKAKYMIWDRGYQVPAYKSKPKDPRAVLIAPRTIEEAKIGLRYYIPAKTLYGENQLKSK